MAEMKAVFKSSQEKETINFQSVDYIPCMTTLGRIDRKEKMKIPGEIEIFIDKKTK